MNAQLGDGNAIRLRESVPLGGFSGAAALDGKGRVLGMMETRNAQLASAEAGLPPVRLIPAAAIRDFLASAQCQPLRQAPAMRAPPSCASSACGKIISENREQGTP